MSKNLDLLSTALSAALAGFVVLMSLKDKPEPENIEVKETSVVPNALEPTSGTESQQPEAATIEVASPHCEESMSGPREAEGHEAPSNTQRLEANLQRIKELTEAVEAQKAELQAKIQIPYVITATYDEARKEAARTRDLLVVIYDTEKDRQRVHDRLKKMPAADKFVWFFTPNTAVIDGTPVAEYFGHPDLKQYAVRHNVVTKESTLVNNTKVLED